MSVVTHLHRVVRTASLRKVTWCAGAKPCYASDIRAIGAALDWPPRTALRDGLRGLDRRLDARFAHAAMPPAELQEAHA